MALVLMIRELGLQQLFTPDGRGKFFVNGNQFNQDIDPRRKTLNEKLKRLGHRLKKG